MATLRWVEWSWADWLMWTALVAYVLAIWAHVRIGAKMFEDGEAYEPLTSSRWVPSRQSPRQMLLLGMFHVAVPLWIAHVAALALVLILAPSAAFPAGLVASLSTAAQGFVVYRNLGTDRKPGKVLVLHYGIQTVAAVTWALHAWCTSCSGGVA